MNIVEALSFLPEECEVTIQFTTERQWNKAKCAIRKLGEEHSVVGLAKDTVNEMSRDELIAMSIQTAILKL